MDRRTALTACGGMCFGLLSSGCLDTLRREDAWRELVVDPPDGVYVPPKIDEMTEYGRAALDGCVLSVAATRPHSFWTVTGTERSRADLRSTHSLHLMASLWDDETDTAIPRPVTATVSREGEAVDRRTLWPMITQRMGFHYGDNVALDGDGTYSAELRFTAVDALATGDFSERFDAVETVELEFEYAAADIDDLDRTLLDADEGRGERGALEPMGTRDHHGGDETGGGRDTDPVSTLARAESLPGEVVGIETGDDITFVVTSVDELRGVDGTYVAVSPRSRYNRYMLPHMNVSGSVARNGRTIFDGSLSEAIDPDLDHHYGAVVGSLESGDELTLVVDTPPQLSRHEGYETAFLDPEPVAITVE